MATISISHSLELHQLGVFRHLDARSRCTTIPLSMSRCCYFSIETNVARSIKKKCNECIPVTFRDDCVNIVEREKDIRIYAVAVVVHLGQGDK